MKNTSEESLNFRLPHGERAVRILLVNSRSTRGRGSCLARNEEVHLGPKAFDLLDLLFLRQRPRAVTKAHVRDALWPRTRIKELNLTSLLTELRSALGDDARHPRFVYRVRGFGYSFCGAATDASEAASSRRSRETHLRLVYQDREVALRPLVRTSLARDDDAVAWDRLADQSPAGMPAFW